MLRAASILATVLLTGATTGVNAQGTQPLVLMHATLIDGNTPVRSGWTVVIDKERIADLFPDGKKPIPATGKVIDLTGRYVIPGLIDAHVHVATDPSGSDANASDQLRGALLGGVTSVRDMAGDAIVLRDLAKSAEAPSAPSPRIYYAAVMAGPSFFGDPRTKAAAHGGTAGELAWLKSITDTTDVAAAVRAAKATGATGLKLYADLPASSIATIAAEGHRQGFKIWSHATVFPARPDDAVKGGVDVISHALLLYWEGVSDVPPRYHNRASRAAYDSVPVRGAVITALFQEMKRRGTVLDATEFVYTRLESAPPGTMGLADPRRALQWMYDVTRYANEMGVIVAAGTDGMMPGNLAETPNIHREMELLVTRSGFTPLQAITAATINSAKAIGIDSQTGTIAAGRIADLVVLKQNPLDDIRNTRQVQLVVKRGAVFERPAAQ